METYESISFELNPNVNINGIKKKSIKLDGEIYTMFNYDKEKMDEEDIEIKKYRSVLFNKNKLVSFSLPKSIKYDKFKMENNLKNEDLLVTEIIEGTMINLFYTGEKWDICTKGSVGGNYFYYRNGYDKKYGKDKQLTFKKMFYDGLRLDTDETFVTLTNNLSKNHCYSFVMQHSENHIVLNNIEPKVYLVAVFELNENNAKYVPVKEVKNMDCVKSIESLVYFPKIIEKMDDFNKMELNYTKDNCELNVGLMYLNEKTGERSHNINETYKKMKNLRGNNPNLQYQYLCLKKIGKVKEFLGFFPQYKDLFYKFYVEYKNFLTNLHQSYLSFYIQKNGEKVNKKYFYHVYRIHHNIYLPSLKETKKVMNKGEIYNYFETYDPIQQLYYLNYNIIE